MYLLLAAAYLCIACEGYAGSSRYTLRHNFLKSSNMSASCSVSA